LGGSAVLKNHYSALPYFEVIALCLFLFFDFCPGHNFKTIRDINMKLTLKLLETLT
jgi:hypothetical protein